MNLCLELLKEKFAICRLGPGAPVPQWAQGEFVSITRTGAELSIVCCEKNVPDDVRREAGWRCLRLAGPFDLSEIGILASLTGPLAAANVGVFVVGTFDTDYLLVREADLPAALETLARAGHRVTKEEC